MISKTISFQNRDSKFDVITEVKYSYSEGLFEISCRSHIHGQGFSDWTRMKARRMTESEAKTLIENSEVVEVR